jgi:3-oxoacyl-[acyl-carrier protein] reductase
MLAHWVAKSALDGYVRYAADELGADGVTINALAPGYTATEANAGMPVAMLDALAAITPTGRVGTPADVANAVGLLADPAASWIPDGLVSDRPPLTQLA